MDNNAYLLRCRHTDEPLLIDAAAEPDVAARPRRRAALGDDRHHPPARRPLGRARGGRRRHRRDHGRRRRRCRRHPGPDRPRGHRRRHDHVRRVPLRSSTWSVTHRARSRCCTTTRPAPPHLLTGDCLFPGGVGNTQTEPETTSRRSSTTWRTRSSTGSPTRPGSTRATATTPPSAPSARTSANGATEAGDEAAEDGGVAQCRDLHGLPATTSERSTQLIDVGCGSGELTLDLAPLVAQVTGVDSDPVEVSAARRAADSLGVDNAELSVGDALAMDFPAAQVDVVFAHSVLKALDRPGDAIAEMRRVLRPGGILGVACVEYGGLILTGPHSEMTRRFYEIREALWLTTGRSVPGRSLRGLRLEHDLSTSKPTPKTISYGTSDTVRGSGSEGRTTAPTTGS